MDLTLTHQENHDTQTVDLTQKEVPKNAEEPTQTQEFGTDDGFTVVAKGRKKWKFNPTGLCIWVFQIIK